MSMVDIRQLTKHYGKARGVQDVTLQLEAGQIFGFIGPNGAGKSTTIRCLMELIHKGSGEILIDGVPVNGSTYRMKEQIGYLPSEIHLYEDLTVQKMLDYTAGFYKKDCRPRMNELVKRLDVEVGKKINALSFGNMKKVGIVLAMMHDPKILIMDEASGGLDPLAQETLYELLLEEKAKGTTVLYSSHILSEIQRICDRVAIIKDGQIIQVAPVDTLTEAQGVRITVESAELPALCTALHLEQPEAGGKAARFMYYEDMNTLLPRLAGFPIQKLLIEELPLEDIFLHYYQEGNDDVQA